MASDRNRQGYAMRRKPDTVQRGPVRESASADVRWESRLGESRCDIRSDRLHLTLCDLPERQ